VDATSLPDPWSQDDWGGDDLGGGDWGQDDLGGDATPWRFPARSARQRFISSVREVVDADGNQVVSNEIYVPGPDRRARPASPLRPVTQRELAQFGYGPASGTMVGVPA
jgi:hypothetical protein